MDIRAHDERLAYLVYAALELHRSASGNGRRIETLLHRRTVFRNALSVERCRDQRGGDQENGSFQDDSSFGPVSEYPIRQERRD